MNSEHANTRFPTECPRCGGALQGVLITQVFLSRDDIVEILGGIITARAASAWMREDWSGSFRLPGSRQRLVDARAFVAALHGRKQSPGSGRQPVPAPRTPVPSSCAHCSGELGGFVAPLELLTVADIVRLLDGKVRSESVATWIRAGLLRGFVLRGVRGVLVDVTDFEEGLIALKRTAGARAIRPTTEL